MRLNCICNICLGGAAYICMEGIGHSDTNLASAKRFVNGNYFYFIPYKGLIKLDMHIKHFR